MRLLNEDSDQAISSVTLLLTKAEAQELRDSLDCLLDAGHAHEHVSSADFKKEITLALYDERGPAERRFSERYERLIKDDE